MQQHPTGGKAQTGAIANGDSALTDAVFTHPYHPTLIGSDTIHHDAAHASCVILPVVPRV
jgi:hypothetical protein